MMNPYNGPFNQNMHRQNFSSDINAGNIPPTNSCRMPPVPSSQLNFCQPFHVDMTQPPPRFLPSFNFQTEIKHHIPSQNFSTPMQQGPQIPPYSNSGNSGIVVNPMMPPFLNTSNTSFLNHSGPPFSNNSHLQNAKQKLTRPTLPPHSLSTNPSKIITTSPKTADEIMVEQFLMKIGKLQVTALRQDRPETKFLKVSC